MRLENKALFSAVDASVDETSAAQTLEHMYGFSALIYMTGASTGTVSWEASNDQATEPGKIASTSWVAIPSSSQVTAAATNYAQNFDGQYYRWVRCKYVKNNGSAGTLTVQFNAKGN
jgi:hypothetical protein